MLTAHIIYATLFRLSIIAVGFGCIVMGYRLFVLGVMQMKGSDFDAQAGEVKLSLKNAAPGTTFAALGIIMIIVMLMKGIPEIKVSELPTKEGLHREVSLRSNGQNILIAITRGGEYEQVGRLDEAIKAYAEPLKDSALSLKDATAPLRAIARVYLKQGRLEEASAYASLSFQIDPDNAECSALIARINLRSGKHDEAIDAISNAARIDPSFIPERNQMTQQK